MGRRKTKFVMMGVILVNLLAVGTTATAHQHDFLTRSEMIESIGWDFSAAEISVEKLTPNLFVLFGLGGNIAVSLGEDGVLIVDDQFPELIPAILETIEGLGGEKIDFVINSHWHFDHADGNLALGETGSLIVAHGNSRKKNTTDQIINLVGVGKYVQPAYPAHALADLTFDEAMQIHFNGEVVELVHFGPAHTSGDTATIFRGNNAVHFGDVFNTGYPFIDAENGGSITGMIEFCNQVLKQIDENTIVIPGHGPISTYSDLETYIGMLSTVRSRLKQMISEGKSLKDILEAKPTREFDSRYGDPSQLIDRAYHSLKRE